MLSSPRLILRRLETDDGPALCCYRSLPDVARYQSWESFGPEEATALIESQRDREPGTAGTWFQLGIVEKSTGRLIGDCGMHFHPDDSRQIELGITLAPDQQRRGYATEAIGCLLAFAFSGLDAHRVAATIDAENRAAESLFKKLAFRKEAHLVEHKWYKGYWDSEYIYALLRREWMEKTYPSVSGSRPPP